MTALSARTYAHAVVGKGIVEHLPYFLRVARFRERALEQAFDFELDSIKGELWVWQATSLVISIADAKIFACLVN